MRYASVLAIASLAVFAGCAFTSAPTIDQFVSPDAPRLSWLPKQGAAKYEVQLARDTRFTSEVRELAVTDDASVSVRDFVRYNKSYFWRVRAVDRAGFKGPWSATGFFRLELPVPQPISPVGETRDPQPAMKWDKAPGAAHYIVQISADELFRFPEKTYETAAKDYFPAVFKPRQGKQYYWRVRAVDPNGAMSVWSKPVAFTVLPSQTTTLTPSAGQVVDTLTPTLAWAPRRNAVRYQVEVVLADQVGVEEPEAIVLAATNGGETSLTPAKALKPDTAYAWRVRPLMRNGPGQWSEWETFRTPKQ
jgi:predicted phage tail protein